LDSKYGLSNLAVAEGQLFAVSDSTIYRLGADQALEEVATVRDVAGRIASFATIQDRLLLTTVRDSTAEILFVSPAAPGVPNGTPVVRARLPGPARVYALPDDFAMVSLVSEPFSMLFFDATGEEVHRITPPIWRHVSPAVGRTERSAYASSSVVSLPVLPLDCQHALQMLVDLKSDQRWFILYRIDEQGMHVVRVRLIEQPIGFVQSIPTDRVLVGVRDLAAGREIVRFHWSWDPTQRRSR
jgi:hypothetical protein